MKKTFYEVRQSIFSYCSEYCIDEDEFYTEQAYITDGEYAPTYDVFKFSGQVINGKRHGKWSCSNGMIDFVVYNNGKLNEIKLSYLDEKEGFISPDEFDECIGGTIAIFEKTKSGFKQISGPKAARRAI